MVIQPNMSPKAIVEVWDFTMPVFKEYNIPLASEEMLEKMVRKDILHHLIAELNSIVGSSNATCTQGG